MAIANRRRSSTAKDASKLASPSSPDACCSTAMAARIMIQTRGKCSPRRHVRLRWPPRRVEAASKPRKTRAARCLLKAQLQETASIRSLRRLSVPLLIHRVGDALRIWPAVHREALSAHLHDTPLRPPESALFWVGSRSCDCRSRRLLGGYIPSSNDHHNLRVQCSPRPVRPRVTRRAPEPGWRATRRPAGATRGVRPNTHLWIEGHHVVHWSDGGPTELENLVCR